MARRGRTPRTPRAYRGSEAEAFKEMLDESLQPKLSVKDRANALRRVILERERAFSNWMGDSEIRFPSDPVARKRSESLLKRFYLGERVPDSALYLRRGMSDEGYQELVEFVSSIPWDRPMPGLYSEHSPLSEKGRQALKQLTEHYARRALDFQFDHRMPGLEAGDVPSAAMLSMMETIARYREPNSLEIWYSNERLVSGLERELDMGVRRTLSQMNQQAREIEQIEVQAGFAEDEDDIYSTLGPTPSRESGGLPAHLRGLANEPLSSIVPAFGKLDPLQRQNFRAFVQSVGFDPDKVTFGQAYQMRQQIKETGFYNADDVMRPMLQGPKTGGLENEWRRFDTVVRNAGQAATLYSLDSETIRDLRRQLYGEEEKQSVPAWEDEVFELEDDTSFTKIYPHLLPSGQNMAPIINRMWPLWKRFARNYRGQLGKQDLLSIDEARYYIGGTNALLHQAGAHYPDVRKVADTLTKLAGMEQGALDKYLTVPNYTADDPSGSVVYLPLSEYEQLYQDELDLLDDLSDRGLRESSLSEIESLTRSDLAQERIAATPKNVMPEPMTLKQVLHGPREERAKQFRAFRNVMVKRQEVWQHPGDIDVAVGGGGERLVQWPDTYSRSEDSLSADEQVAAAYQRGDLFYREADAISSLRAAYEAWLDTQDDPDVGPAAFREFARQRGVRVDVLDRMLHSQGGAPVLSPEEVLQLMEEGALPSQRVFEPDEPAATEEPEPEPFTPEPLPTWRVSTVRRAPIPKAKEPARQPRVPGRPGKPVPSYDPDRDALPEDRFEELSAEAQRAATPVTAQRETADSEGSPDGFPASPERNTVESQRVRVRLTPSQRGEGADPGLSLRRRRTWYAKEPSEPDPSTQTSPGPTEESGRGFTRRAPVPEAEEPDDILIPEDRYQELSAEAKRLAAEAQRDATSVAAQRETTDSEVSPDSFPTSPERDTAKGLGVRVRPARSQRNTGGSLRQRRVRYGKEPSGPDPSTQTPLEDRPEELSVETQRDATPVAAQRETTEGEVSPDSFLAMLESRADKNQEGRVRAVRSQSDADADPSASSRQRRRWDAPRKPNRGANEEPPPPDWDKISDADAPPDDYADEFYDPRGTLRNQQDQGWKTPPQRTQRPHAQRSEPPQNVADKPTRPQYAANEQDDGTIRWKKRDPVDENVWHDVDESEVPSYVRDPNDPNYDPNAAFRHESGWLAMQRALASEAEEEETPQASPPAPEAARQADPAPGASRQEGADAESGKDLLPEYMWKQERRGKRWYKKDPTHPTGWREVKTKDVPSRVRDPKDPDYDESLSFGWDLEILGLERTRWSNWIREGDTEYRYNISGWEEEERWQSRPAEGEGERPSRVDPENVPAAVRQKRQDAFNRAQSFNKSQGKPLRARIESGEVDPDTGELLEDRGIALRVGLIWQAKREIHEERTKSDDPEAKLDSVHRAVGLRYAGALLEAEDPRYWGPARREKTGLDNRGLDRAFHIASEAIYSALESSSPNLDDGDWLAELVHKVRTSIRDQILKETKALDQRGGGSRADRDLLAQINDAAADVAKSFFNSLGEILGQGGAGVSAYQAAVSRLYERTTSLHGKHQADLLAQMYETDERFQRAVDARGGLERVKREGAYIPSSALSDDPSARDLVIQGAGDALGGGRAFFGLGGRGSPYAAIRAWYALRALKGVFDLTFAQGAQDMAQAVDFTNAVSAAIGEGQSQLGIWVNQTANRQIASGIAAYQNFGFAYDAANQVLGDVGTARLVGGLRFAAGVGVSGPIASAISAMAGMGAIPGLGWATAIVGLALGSAYVGNEFYNALTGDDRGLGDRIGGALGLTRYSVDEQRAYRERLAIARSMGLDANRNASISLQATRLYGKGAGDWAPDFSQVDITGTPGYEQIRDEYRTDFMQKPLLLRTLAVAGEMLYRWVAGPEAVERGYTGGWVTPEDFAPATLDTTVNGVSPWSLSVAVQKYGAETGLGDDAFKFLSDMAAALYPVDYRTQRDLVHFSALRQDYDQDLDTSYWAQITKEMRERVASTLFDQDAANEFIESLLPVGTTDLRQIAAVDAASRYVGSAAAYGIDFRHKGEQIVSSILSGDVTLEQSAVHSELFGKQLAMGAPAWLAYANIDPTLPVDQQQALFAGIQQQYELTGTYRAIADPERYLAMSPGARRSWHELQAQAQRYGGDIWDIQAVQEDFDRLKGFQRESLPTLYAAYQRGGGTPEEVARQAILSVADLTPEQVAGQEAIAAALYAADQQFSMLDLRRWSQAVTLPEARRLSEGIAQMESAGFSGTGITDRLASLVAQTSGTDFASALDLSELYSAMGLSGVGMDFIEEAGQAGTEASQAVSRITQWQRAIGLSPRRAQVQGFQMGMRFSDPLSASLYLEMGDLAFATTGDPIAALRFAEEAPGMDFMTRRYYQGIMRGDQWQLSRMARLYPELGLTPFFTESGHDTFWERGLALDDRQWALSTQSRQFQLGMGQEQFAQQQAMTFGGTFFNPVTGQMQTLQYGRLDIQDALFDLSVRQQRYYLDYQQRQLDTSNQYQAQQMQRNWEQMQTRFDWRIADWQYGENVNQLQFAWSMEDYDENIRFATGRQRRLLMRQRDRAVIQETMRRGHSEEERERIDIEREWAREAHEAQRQYFEENKSLQQERLERERQFFEERLVWQNREREMSRLSAELENNRQQRELQHQNWMFQQEQALHNEQRQMKIDQANMVAEWRYFMETQMPNWLRSISTNLSVPPSGSGSYSNQPGYQMPSAPGMGGGTPSSGMNTSGKYYYSSKGPVRTDQYDPNESGGMTAGEWYQWRWLDGMPHFRSGGYTGDGLPGEIAGLAHKREWVVPEHGSLVVRGDNPETVAILKQIHAVLAQIASKGIANLTFNYSGRDFQSQMNYARDLLDRTYQ